MSCRQSGPTGKAMEATTPSADDNRCQRQGTKQENRNLAKNAKESSNDSQR